MRLEPTRHCSMRSEDGTVLHLFGVMHQQCGHSHTRRRADRPGDGVASRSGRLSRQPGRSCAALGGTRRLPNAAARPAAAAGLSRKRSTTSAWRCTNWAAMTRRWHSTTPPWSCGPILPWRRTTAVHALWRSGKTTRGRRSVPGSPRPRSQAGLTHANLGQMLADDGNLLEGLAHCREAVRHGPELPAAHNNLGNVLRGLGALGRGGRRLRGGHPPGARPGGRPRQRRA